MADDKITIEIQLYPDAVEWKPGPPILTMAGFPPLPGEDYIAYGRRVAAHLGVPPVR